MRDLRLERVGHQRDRQHNLGYHRGQATNQVPRGKVEPAWVYQDSDGMAAAALGT